MKLIGYVLFFCAVVVTAECVSPILHLTFDDDLANQGTYGGSAEWKNPLADEAARISGWDQGKALDLTAVPKDAKPGNNKRGGAVVWDPASLSRDAKGVSVILRFETKGMPPNARLFNSPLFNILPDPLLYVNVPGSTKTLSLENSPSLASGVWWIAVTIRFSDGYIELHLISDKDRSVHLKNKMTVGAIDPAMFKGPFEIGNYFGIRPFRGFIDDVMLIDAALPESEIVECLPAQTAVAAPVGFVHLFRPLPPSEKVFIEPSVWGAVRQDEILGPSICFRLRAPYYRRTWSYVPQLPHKGIQLKARTTTAAATVVFEVRGKAVSSGRARNVLLKTRPIRVDTTASEQRLMYANDFEPSADGAEFIGESIQSIVITANTTEDTDLVLSDIRALSGVSAPVAEIRRTLHEGHVFTEDEHSSLAVEVFSRSPGAARFSILINRQDNAFSKRSEETVVLKGGEETIHLGMEGLPRGYYSVSIEMETAGAKHASGSHVVIVPKGTPEAWLGTHESDVGGDIVTLKDHRKAGFGWLRFTAANPFMRVDIRKDIDLLDSLIAPRAQLGFKIVFSFSSFPRPSVDWTYFDKKAKEYDLKLEVPMARYNADPAYPMEDIDWMKNILTFLSKNLKGKAEYYEFGNEFDRIIFPGARYDSGKKEFDWWGTPDASAAELIPFREGIKRGNPDAKVLNAGVTCGLWTPGRETFVPRMLDAGGAKGFDIFAVHGYGGYDNVQRVLGDLRARGLQKPWANTERGIGSQDLVAHRLALEEILSSKRDGAMFYTTFFPERLDYLADPGTGQHGPYKQALSEFATMLPDGAPGPKFAMEAALAHLLSRAKDLTNKEGSGITRWRWNGDAGYVYLLYAEKAGTRETFVSASAITAIDLYGNADASASLERTVEITPKPVYLVSESPILSTKESAVLSASGPHPVLSANEPALEYRVDGISDLKLQINSGASTPAQHNTEKGIAIFQVPSAVSSFRNNMELISGSRTHRSTVSWATTLKGNAEKIDWSKASFFEVDQAAQLMTGRVLWQGLTDHNIYKGTVFGTSNSSARIAFALSGQTLSFRIEITDDELCEADEIELVWLDPKEAGKFRARPDVSQPLIESNLRGLEIAAARRSNGWLCTGNIPADIVFAGGRVPRFELIIRDADTHADAGKMPYLEMRAGAGDGVYLWP